jgi:two-component system response regulator FixJ
MMTKNPVPRIVEHGNSPTIYVIDPAASVRASMTSLLGTLRVRVETFETAAEFFDALDPTMGACLVTELHLPDMNGIEIQRHLMKRELNIPVIILASEADVATAVSAMSSGVFDFIEKPFVGRALLGRLRQVLSSRARGEPLGCRGCQMIVECRRQKGSTDGRSEDELQEDSLPD